MTNSTKPVNMGKEKADCANSRPGDNTHKLSSGLLDYGYIITPIRPNSKAAFLKNWQKLRLTPEDFAHYPGYGIGVLCGVGENPLVALDLDIYDEEVVTDILDFVGMFYDFPVRQGKAPKRLLVMRTATPMAKRTTAYFHKEGLPDSRVEVLGTGQQFVAYGVHPGTGKPYAWLDGRGGLTAWPVDDLPVVNEGFISDVLAYAEQALTKHGWTKGKADAAPAPRGELTELEQLVGKLPIDEYPLERAVADLEHISADNYDQWLKVGMALHHQYDGDPDAFSAWVDWSSTSANFSSVEQCEAKWESFGHNDRMPVRATYIIKLAQANERDAKAERDKERIADLTAELRSASTKAAIEAVVRKAQIDDIDARNRYIDAVRVHYKEVVGKTISVASIKRLMPAPAVDEHTMDDFGNTDRFIERYGDRIRYVQDIGQWLECMENGYWVAVDVDRIRGLAVETIDAATVAYYERTGEPHPFLAKSRSAKSVREMVNLAQSDPRVATTSKYIDDTTGKLAVENAVIDLQTMRATEPDPKAMIISHSSVAYDPEATCPLWHATLESIFLGNYELIAFVQRLVGYTFLGSPKENVVIIPYGTGANGKSTFLNILSAIAGDYGINTPADVFMRTRSSTSSGPNEALTRFKGKRLISSAEMKEESVVEEGLLKAMTGGDKIVARGMYARYSMEITPTWVIWLGTNYRPTVRGQDYGIWRRLMTIPFTACFRDGERDPQRYEHLLRELPGILNWVLEGVANYLERGLDTPDCVKNATEEYRQEMDIIGGFLEECCEFGPDFEVLTADLYSAWAIYADQRGELSLANSARKLGRMLSARGFELVRFWEGANRAKRGFKGIRLKPVEVSTPTESTA